MNMEICSLVWENNSTFFSYVKFSSSGALKKRIQHMKSSLQFVYTWCGGNTHALMLEYGGTQNFFVIEFNFLALLL